MTKIYLWIHPDYKKPERCRPDLLEAQIVMAGKCGIELVDDLSLVTSEDYLILLGHSNSAGDADNDGMHMQGETASQLLVRLQEAGLSVAPLCLSFMCCHSGIEDGLAVQMSALDFLSESIVEAPRGGVGFFISRFMGGFQADFLGRVVLGDKTWQFFNSGVLIASHKHASYDLSLLRALTARLKTDDSRIPVRLPSAAVSSGCFFRSGNETTADEGVSDSTTVGVGFSASAAC